MCIIFKDFLKMHIQYPLKVYQFTVDQLNAIRYGLNLVKTQHFENQRCSVKSLSADSD